MSFSRRDFVKASALAASLPMTRWAQAQTAPEAAANPSSDDGVTLRWLEGEAPARLAGTTWGVPWPKGALQPSQGFELRDENGVNLPLQSWALATWPDGSLKWSAHSVGPMAQSAKTFQLRPGAAAAPEKRVTVRETPGEITVETGVLRCRMARSGANLFASLERDGKIIARDGHLVCLQQNRADAPESGSVSTQSAQSRVQSITVEQSGPVRAVVKIEGKHRTASGREWLPFVVRLYFHAGSDAIRVMHTFIFDGDEKRDFIRGLGVRFSVPMRDELHNRHVRFGGEGDGLWGEGVRNLSGLRRSPGEAAVNAQIEGKATPPVSEFSASARDRLQYVPAWGDYTLSQLSSDGFTIRKRTKEGHGWIPSGAGRRAGGSGYIGGASGGVAFGLRDFWQRYPAQLDIRGATSDEASVTMWLYSPEAPPMDLRFYHDGLGMDTYAEQNEGLEVTYEDYEPGYGTPYGVARTGEMLLWAAASTPLRRELADFARSVQTPPLLVAAPEQFLKAQVFGALWSLPDRSTPQKAAIENQLDHLLAMFSQQREQHRWYGFWDYGDWMHSYDGARHVWKYDVGGFAWANSELSPDLWVWYAFLRSGRADVFRLAEAMTRHTGEVDVHHIGPYAGLGSRHNVQHWGDSSKQARVSNAAYKRIFFYLTADERTGDLIRELLSSEPALASVDVGRKIGAQPGPNPPTKSLINPDGSFGMSIGTTWCSMVAAWLTEYERTGNTFYRDRIVNGMKGIGAMPRGWFSSGVTFDPRTGRMNSTSTTVSVSHLSAVFGAVEISAGMLQNFDVPEYRAAWLQYCRLYNAPAAEQQAELGAPLRRLNLGEAHSRLPAYAAAQTRNPQLAARAWKEFYGGAAGLGVRTDFNKRRFEGPQSLNPVEESMGMSTNAASQWGLAAIQNLGLIGESLPEEGA